MINVFRDSGAYDVFFICDEVLGSNRQVSWRKRPSQEQQPTLGDSADAGGNLDDGSERRDTEESDCAMTPTTREFNTQKIVLSQWPYFKAIFSSPFAEGSSGTTEIRIKDVNTGTFLQMLLVLNLSELDSPPDMILESDGPVKAKDASWEGPHLAVHRYRIDDLREQALKKILGHMDKSDALALLFRCVFFRRVARLCDQIYRKETPYHYCQGGDSKLYKNHLSPMSLLENCMGRTTMFMKIMCVPSLGSELPSMHVAYLSLLFDNNTYLYIKLDLSDVDVGCVNNNKI